MICPISLDIMRDPVMTCDGLTYERVDIEKWLQNNDTSPKTNLKLANKNLFPNYALKEMIN